jgi:ABC-2 type transport system permease protein
MSALTTAGTVVMPAPSTAASAGAVRTTTAFAALSRRRFALSAHTPRELLVPLVTPILFADVIAPALAKTMGAFRGIDYVSFVAVGTIGLLVPLACVLGGVGMIVDRQSGAQRDLLAAPVPRSMLVLGNLSVALVVSALQVFALFGAAVLRGADFHVTASGTAWAVAAILGLAIAMHGVAEVLASKLKTQEEYIGAAPPIALVPWFFAGSFFSISSMPAGLTVFAKMLPLTHALALLRYALVDQRATGLHDIWGMSNVTAMAALSLTVVVLFAALMTAVGIRAFTRSAIS